MSKKIAKVITNTCNFDLCNQADLIANIYHLNFGTERHSLVATGSAMALLPQSNQWLKSSTRPDHSLLTPRS
jgi:hypothetical protein